MIEEAHQDHTGSCGCKPRRFSPRRYAGRFLFNLNERTDRCLVTLVEAHTAWGEPVCQSLCTLCTGEREYDGKGIIFDVILMAKMFVSALESCPMRVDSVLSDGITLTVEPLICHESSISGFYYRQCWLMAFLGIPLVVWGLRLGGWSSCKNWQFSA